MTAASRIAALRSEILKAKQAYYYGGQPIMTDQEYDALEDELRRLAPDDPVLALVGAPVPPDAMLTKAEHRLPMGSQSKVNSATEFRTWLAKSPVPTLHASLKGDGASAAAYYETGRLMQVISRGDGTVGEDITANAIKFQGLPAYVMSANAPFTGAVRVEVILTVEDWGRVDPTRAKNPRNAGAGIMGRKNGQQAELLTAFAFDLVEEGVSFAREQDKTDRLAALGFQVIPHRICEGADPAIEYFEQIAAERDELPFWIDGVVFKVDDIAAQIALGITANRPKGQIAWKFDSSGAETQLLNVVISGGHTGALIPNAELAPVEIGGTTVRSASLANFDEVARLDVAVGDHVWVIKANDIIPKIVRVTQRAADRRAIEPPTTCPFCDGSVGRRLNTGGAEGTVVICQNEDCPQKAIGKVKRWIRSVDIQGIGDSVRTALVDQLGLEDAADLYGLRDRAEELAELVINQEKDLRLGAKRAKTILDGIEATRRLTLAQFLGSLGIERLGQRRVELITEAAGGELDTLADWRAGKLRQPALAERAGVPNIGDGIQDGIDAMSDAIDRLLGAGVLVADAERAPAETTPAAAPLQTVCISGKLPSGKKKSDYAAPLAAAGYQLVDSVTRGLTYLVLADPDSTSTKAKKARDLDVKIISEAELEALV